jgi:signal peptidase I
MMEQPDAPQKSRKETSGDIDANPSGKSPENQSFSRSVLLAITGPWTTRNAITWIVLLLSVLCIRWLVFEPYKIPTGSMEPTLHGDMRLFRGDRIGANKLIYGPRIPFTNIRLFRFAEPKRWEIVVFHTPQKDADHSTLVKRVVGLPGERINIKDGKIYVNGQPVEPPDSLKNVLYYTSSFVVVDEQLNRFILKMAAAGDRVIDGFPNTYERTQLAKELAVVRKKLAARNPETITPEEITTIAASLCAASRELATQFFRAQQESQYPMRYGILEDEKYSVVPEGCYLLCGDNSADSADGRVFGWVPNGNILGRVFCIWAPPSRMRDLTGFSNTWWGKSLLYGIPLLLVASEIVGRIRRKRANA